jgi:hypothetical protein
MTRLLAIFIIASTSIAPGQWVPYAQSGITGDGRRLAVFDSGAGARLYVSGVLTNAGGVPVAGIASFTLL